MTPRKLLLARRAVDSAASPVFSPWDGRTVGLVSQADTGLANEAAIAADEAARPLAAATTDERRRLLEETSRELVARAEEFAQVICLEAAKPITLARVEVLRAAEVFHLCAGEAERLGGELLPIDLAPNLAGHRALVRPVPRGPALAIGPFNFPLNLLAHKIAPALAAGCPVVVKPPPQAPSAALMLGELLASLAPSQWPAGFLSVLPCANEVADRLVGDERFRVVSFTGSDAVGWHVRQRAQKAHVVLELGGDAAVIVCADADLDRAATRVAWGAYAYAGQVCISVQRIFVEESVRAAFTSKLVEAIRALPVGAPSDGSTVCGPVIDDRAAERLDRLASDSGTALVRGTRQGRLLSPTLIDDVSNDSPLAGHEAFGPIAGLSGFRDFEEALEAVERSPFGLQAGLFTNNMRRIFRAHEQLRVGALVVNDVPTLRVDSYPYGGTKGSGQGREGGRFGVLEFTEPRTLVLNTRG